jgi:RNA polymerase sigma-70 factor (ECF subfamily)
MAQRTDLGERRSAAPSEPPPRPSSPPVRIVGDDPRIKAAAGGDRAAASALLTELLPRTRNLVRFLVPGDSDVDDFAQAALIEVLRSLPSFRGESALTTWADRITVRTVMRLVGRRQRERTERAQLDPAEHAVHSSLQDGADFSARRRLARVLDTIPEAQRTALVMHHVVGLSVPELAEELGLSFDTVKSRLRLGMERLRKHYVQKDDHG